MIVSGIPTGAARLRWRAAAGGPSLDVRAQRSLLTATPQMLASRVTRSELRATAELPLLRAFRLRGMGRAAALSESGGTNYPTGMGGGLVLKTGLAEVALQGQEIRFSRPTSAGYFAPRLAQLVEAGSYVEFEAGSWAVFALDAGLGLQRSAEFGAPIGHWGRALRFYSLVSLRLAPGRELRLELEGEDSPLANDAATGAGWRYAAAALSLRWGM